MSRTILGAIFHDGEEANYEAFKKALAMLDKEQIAPAFELRPVIKWINSSTDSFKTSLAGKSTNDQLSCSHQKNYF